MHPFLFFADGRVHGQTNAGVAVRVDHVVMVHPLDDGRTAVDSIDQARVYVDRPWEQVMEAITAHPSWTAPQRVTYVDEPDAEPQRPSPWMPLVMHLVEAASTWMASTPEGEALTRHVSQLVGLDITVGAGPTVKLPSADSLDRDEVSAGVLSHNGWAPLPPHEDADATSARWESDGDTWRLTLHPGEAEDRLDAIWLEGAAVHVPDIVLADNDLQAGWQVVWHELDHQTWLPSTQEPLEPTARTYAEDPDTTGDGLG